MKKQRLFFGVCILLCLIVALSGCSSGPFLTIWGEEPLGVSLPPAEEVEVLQRVESKGKDPFQNLWIQFTDEQAAQFEQDIAATDVWSPLPLPKDIAEFYSGNSTFSFAKDSADFYTQLLAVENGDWILYNFTDQKYMSRALVSGDTRSFTCAVYDADTKQLFISEERFF